MRLLLRTVRNEFKSNPRMNLAQILDHIMYP